MMPNAQLTRTRFRVAPWLTVLAFLVLTAFAAERRLSVPCLIIGPPIGLGIFAWYVRIWLRKPRPQYASPAAAAVLMGVTPVLGSVFGGIPFLSVLQFVAFIALFSQCPLWIARRALEPWIERMHSAAGETGANFK